MSDADLLKKISEDLSFLKKKVNHMEDLLEEIVYPKEELLNEEFVEKVQRAEGRIKKGKGIEFESVDELFESAEQ